MSEPLFSIITVTYNAQSTVGATMESVGSQTCDDYEHIIVDGASRDSTIEIVSRMRNDRTRITSQRDRGIYDAMNRGIDMSRGRYLIFLNAGDTFHACDTLSLIADAIHKNDNPGIVYGQTDLVDHERHYIGPRHLTAPPNLTLKSFANGMLVCHQAMAVRKQITGLYSMKYRFSADYEWVIRCLQNSQNNVYIDTVLIDYLDEGTTTRNHRASLLERFKIMCHYYGTLPTIGRHTTFAVRHLKRRLTGRYRQ